MKRPKLKKREEGKGYTRKYYSCYSIYLMTIDEYNTLQQLKLFAKSHDLDLKSFIFKAGLKYGKKKSRRSTPASLPTERRTK